MKGTCSNGGRVEYQEVEDTQERKSLRRARAMKESPLIGNRPSAKLKHVWYIGP